MTVCMTVYVYVAWYARIAKEKPEEEKEKQKHYYDRNTKRKEFYIGDQILLKEMAFLAD